MSRKMFDEKQSFSLRKYAVGLCSVLLGASLVSASPALADATSVDTHFVDEKDLTAEVRQELKWFEEGKIQAEVGKTYYFVYRKDGVLPMTGSTASNLLLAGGALLLVGLTLVKKKSGKLLFVLTFFSLAGGLGQVLALENIVEIRPAVLKTTADGILPAPEEVPGYTFTGWYFVLGGENGEAEQPTPTTPALPAEPTEPVSPVEPEQPAVPTEPTSPVAPVEPVTPVTPTQPVEPTNPVTPTPQPQPDPTPTPEPTPTPDPQPDPDPTPNPIPTPDPQPDPTPTPEPTTQKGSAIFEEELPEARIESIPYQNSYEADPTLEYEKQVETGGENGEKITEIRKVRQDDGTIKEQEVVIHTKDAVDKVIKIGNVQITKVPVPKTVEITEDETIEKGTVATDVEGKDGINTIVTTYAVNDKTGTLENPTSQTEETEKMIPQKETWGTVETTSSVNEMGVIYKPDETLPLNEHKEETAGKAGINETYRKYYHVVDGKYADKPYKETTEVVNEPSQDKVVRVGTKPTIKETPIPFTTTYIADPTAAYESKTADGIGQDGKELVTTTYSVDIDGKTYPNEPTTTRKEPKNVTVKVGNVQTVVAPIAVETEEIDDPELEKGTTEVRDPGTEGSQTTTTTYEVDPKTGKLTNPTEKTDITKPMVKKVIAKGTKETVEKQVDFNDVTSRELYKVTENGALERVTGFDTAPTDSASYLLKLIRRDHKDVLLPVSNIEATGDRFKVTSNGEEFASPEELLVDKIVIAPGTYTKFSKLIEDMKAKPTETFKLASDVVADATTDTTYLTDFKGTLTSVDGKLYAIKGLTKPLFNTLTGATVKNLRLDEVNIATTGHDAISAPLALTATNATVENVHAKGVLTSGADAAGMIHTTNNTTLNKVSFIGSINVNKTHRLKDLTTGGIVGNMSGGSLTNALSDATMNITVTSPYSSKQVGGVVGKALNTSNLDKLVAKGSIDGKVDSGQVGGVIGQIGFNPASNLVSYVTNPLGDKIYGGFAAYAGISDAYKVAGTTAKSDNVTWSKEINTADADSKVNAWSILPTETTSSDPGSDSSASTPTDAPVDYTKVDKAQQTRATAYANVSKLLPFYDAKTIVKYGNEIDTNDKLFKTKVAAVVALEGDTPVGLTDSNKEGINKILIRYEDGTVEKRTVTYVAPYKNSKVVEYRLDNGLIFTPEQLLTNRSSLISELATAFKAVAFDSADMQKAVKLDEANKDNAIYKMEDLFWKSTFENVQENIETILSQILANNIVLGQSDKIDETIKHKLLDKKAEVLTGLSYLARLYDIHFDGMSIKNILTYRPDFYGQKQDVVDWLASFANLGFKDLQVMNNEKTYNKHVANVTGKATVRDFLESQKDIFAPKQTVNEWYTNTTKAMVVEEKSGQRPDEKVDLYTWLTSYEDFRAYLLPLLNLRDDSIYVTTNMSFITFGLKDRHINDQALLAKRTSNPAEYKEAIKQVEEKVRANAKRWAKFVDTWYGIVDDNVKEKLVRPHLSVWAGLQMNQSADIASDYWLSQYDTNYKAVEDFMAATGDYFSWANKPASARSAVRLQDNVPTEYSKIEYIQTDLLTDEGASTLSHEFVHAMDEIALLDGYKLRPDQDPESYAYGLLESSITKDGFYYALNLMQDFSGELATSNKTVDRFKNAEDIGQYVKGLYDVTYTLDAIEAESILALPKDKQKLFFDKIVRVNQQVANDGTINYDDEIREITNAEWNSLNLKSINDLIDRDLVAYDTTSNIRKKYVRTDAANYYNISLTSPIYSGFQNTTGTSSGLLFRKMAWDVLAEKGWRDGFIPFASNKLVETAKQENTLLTDEYAFKKVMDSKSYANFKKEQYAKHLTDAKSNKLKAVTIDFEGKSYTVDSYTKLKELMDLAVKQDHERVAERNNNRFYVQQQSRQRLKEAIIKAYHQATDDFTSSIYK